MKNSNKHIDLPIKSLNLEIRNETLILSSVIPLNTLSSGLVGGGFGLFRNVLNHHVEKDFSHTTPSEYLIEKGLELGINEKFIGMMTAAELENFGLSYESREMINVLALVTGGISNAARAGENIRPKNQKAFGTINTLLIFDRDLERSAMVGAVITATEAKSAALSELGIYMPDSKKLATGTTTDSITIANMGKGEKLPYAGTGTPLGRLIGRTVKKATVEAVKKQENLFDS